MSAYADFLARKAAVVPPVGLTHEVLLPPRLFEFQTAIVRRHLRLGRGAIFAATGLGKTGMQLAWADAIAEHEGGQVLILTPLAVAKQTVAEAAKFAIADVAYAASQSEVATRIVVTNYDRMHLFDPSEFIGIVLDESSILKAHDSQTRAALTEAFKSYRYRLACSATPAPNDWTELGNHSEFLGVATAKGMLATYFVHDGAIRASGEIAGTDGDGWRLKRHAARDFWAWVSSWATLVRHPREIGFEQDGYDLPPLVKRQVSVPVEYKPCTELGTLFPIEARTMGERQGARRDSLESRVKVAADIVNAAPDRPWLVWCHLNAEADALEAAIPESLQVKGSHDRQIKTDRLLGFVHSKPRVLISKPTIAGHGMNYQHCADMVFVGLSDSFEQLFQAIRRCWRFGQTRPVTVYMIASELEGAVVANLERKEADHETMADAMGEHLRDFMAALFSGHRPRSVPSGGLKMELPAWIA